MLLTLVLVAAPDAPVASSLAPTAQPVAQSAPPPSLRGGGIVLIATGATVAVVSGLLEALVLAALVPYLQAGRNTGPDGFVMAGVLFAAFSLGVGAIIGGAKMIATYRTLNQQHLLSQQPQPQQPPPIPLQP